MKLSWLPILLCACPIHSQVEVVLTYDNRSGTIIVPDNGDRVKSDGVYTVKLTGVNSAHIETLGTVSISKFVSNVPEVLKPIFTGIPDNSIFNLFQVDGSGQRKAFLHAIKSFNDLEKLRGRGDALYATTRFAPDTVVARGQRDALLRELGLGSLDEVAVEIEQSKNFVDAVLESYSSRMEQLYLSDSSHHIILSEYATLKRIKSKMGGADYAHILNFIEASTTARDHLIVGAFKAGKDVVDLELSLLDTFTKDTIYDSTLSFRTYGNFSFDFSTGFFYSDLVDRTYYLRPRNAESNDVLLDDGDRTDISIGGLGHFVYRFTPGLGAGIALGASLSPLDGNLRYLFGPTAMVGHQKQFGLTFGLAVARLEKLSDAVPRDASGPYLPSGEGIKTIKKVDTGLFVGITYNLTRKKQ